MMKLKALAIAAVLALGSLVGTSLVTADTYAECTCPKGSLRGEGASCNSLAECNIPEDAPGTEKDLVTRIVDIINVVVGVVGILAVIAIVVGGIFFVLSTGDAAKTTRAKNTVLYGVIGLVVAMLAFALVNFVSKAIFSGGSSGGGGGDDDGGGEGESGLVIDSDIA